MRRHDRTESGPEMVTAAELAASVYCAEQWPLEYGLGLEAGNRAAREAGTWSHGRTTVAERVAGGAIGLGRAPVVLAVLGLLVA